MPASSTTVVIGAALGGLGALMIVVIVSIWSIMNCIGGREKRGRVVATERITRNSDLGLKQLLSTDIVIIFVQAAASDHPTRTPTAEFEKEVGRMLSKKADANANAYLEQVQYPKRNVAKRESNDIKRVFAAGTTTNKYERNTQQPIVESSQIPIVGQHLDRHDHMIMNGNIVTDMFDCEILVVETPIRAMHDLTLEVIWQRNVGVVVWLGPMKDPYFSIHVNDTIECNRFDVKTTNASRYGRLFKLYSITIKNRVAFSTVDFKRASEVYVVHIESWPSKLSTGKSGKEEAASLAMLVEMVRSTVLQQIETQLPTLLIHCKDGLDWSCTFAGIYLSRQLYLRFNTLNVKFVLKLLARARLGAFESGDKSFDQIRLLHAVVAEMINKYPRPRKGADTPIVLQTVDKDLGRATQLVCVVPRTVKKSAPQVASMNVKKSDGGTKQSIHPGATEKRKTSDVSPTRLKTAHSIRGVLEQRPASAHSSGTHSAAYTNLGSGSSYWR